MKGITKTQKEYVKKEIQSINATIQKDVDIVNDSLKKDFNKINTSVNKLMNYAVETGYKIGYEDAKNGRKPQFK